MTSIALRSDERVMMDQQPGQQQVGLYSADGRWWWDGQAWQTAASPAASRMAIASLVLGIVSMIAWLLPIVGLPVSAVALGLGVKGRGGPGRRMAIAGIVLASIALALTLMNSGLAAYLSIRRDLGGA